MQGQLSKFTSINTVTSFRALVKSHKGLKGTVGFNRRCFTVKLIWKISQNIHSKETVMKSFSAKSQPAICLKRTPSKLFSDEFPRLFIILFCVKTPVKSRKSLKGTETFAQRCLRKKLI